MREKWREWEPRTRREGLRALRRACIEFTVDDAPKPRRRDLAWLEWILKSPRPDIAPPAEGAGGESHWHKWSAPIATITASDLQALVERYRVNERNPAKLTSPATERRFVADVRQFWDDSANRHDFQDPWPKVKLRTKGRGASDQPPPEPSPLTRSSCCHRSVCGGSPQHARTLDRGDRALPATFS
jgi:hypothetical protein